MDAVPSLATQAAAWTQALAHALAQGDATGAAALFHADGHWRDILALAEALERHDLTSAGELADAFGGLDRVLTLSDEAWGWAASVQRELDA